MQDLQTGGATVQQGTIELHHQDPTIARRQDPMTELLPSPLARFLLFFPLFLQFVLMFPLQPDEGWTTVAKR